MIALVSVFVVLIVSLLITRVATLALTMTGLSRESARFQARSALSGVGFTTSEAESVVNHPVRRRVVLALMLVGSAGVVTAAASLIVSFGGADAQGGRLTRAAILLAGLVALWLISRSRAFDRAVGFVIAPVLHRAGIATRDWAALLELGGDYAVHEFQVCEDDWVARRRLGDLKLREEGIAVLGIRRVDGTYEGVPVRESEIEPGDQMIVYGHTEHIQELDERPAGPQGDEAHAAAVRKHRWFVEQENEEERERADALSGPPTSGGSAPR